MQRRKHRSESILLLLLGSAAILLFAPLGSAYGQVDPSSLWLLPGETYVDISNENTTNAWNFPDTSNADRMVNGNSADSKDVANPVPQMDMTVSGLNANTQYYVDFVMLNATNNETKVGLAAGFSSPFEMANYDGVGTAGWRVAYTSPEKYPSQFLSRIPIGSTTSDAMGAIHVYFDEYDDAHRAQLDGIIVYETPTTTERFISAVNRSGGAYGTKVPYGEFTDDSDPFLGDDCGLQLGSRVMSDRSFSFNYVDEALRGADYVRMFNDDKALTSGLTYSVTLDERTFVMVLVPDITQTFDDDANPETPSVNAQQACVDLITAAIAP
ncbi:MAG TPA: hypothetical protein DD670_20115, partial [Planctomycetaceae bacterium]|nr:hypothetical protein [Planctomycetaceae bacterium]